MLASFHLAGIITAIFAICGPAMGQQIAPADSGVTINKQVIDNGSSHSVKYYVTGGSPQLQALIRRVEWAENELSVIEQLQLLKLDTVVNERRLAAVHAAQLTNPYFPSGFVSRDFATTFAGASSLQRAFGAQLAYEATPQAVLQLIGFLEQQQSQLEAELKALPPQEKKAIQGPMEALRPRLAALPRGSVSPPPLQPAALDRPLPGGPPAAVRAETNPVVDVDRSGSWFSAEVLGISGTLTLIVCTNWS
jgi:hypothetical protein